MLQFTRTGRTRIITGFQTVLNYHYYEISKCKYSSTWFKNENVSNNFLEMPITPNEVKLFLQKRRIDFKEGWTSFRCENVFHPDYHSRVKQTMPTSTTLPRTMNCYINKTTGSFQCVDSDHKGSWQLYQEFCNTKIGSNMEKYNELVKKLTSSNANTELHKAEDIWKTKSKPFSDLTFEEIKVILSKYKLDEFDFGEFLKYHIQCIVKSKELVIPYFVDDFHKSTTKENAIQGIKVIQKDRYCTHEDSNVSTEAYSLHPPTDFVGLFGLKQVNSKTSKIVLTANEFDAMAINACSKYAAISLPVGITYLPLNALPHLERFSEIILWFGSSLLSLEAAQLFAKKLGSVRCKIVRPRTKNTTALQSFRSGSDIDKIINVAMPADMKNIVSFTDLKLQIKDEFSNRDEFSGVPWKRFYNLNKKLKGHRRGELTILTGPTGSGKTTLLSELSLDLAMQGVTTLWGSFEISNKRLLMCMLKQYSRIPLESNMDKFDSISENFAKLPITFMAYNGPEDVANVLKTMYQVTYANDIQHIVIDNLQFMTGSYSGMDRFAYQDNVIFKFRQFATNQRVHITLVIHPRKEDHNIPLQLSSIFGSAKATQEADNVLILQKLQQQVESEKYPVVVKYLEVVKNRYDGDMGRVNLYFNRDTLCMSPDIQPQDQRSSKTESTTTITQMNKDADNDLHSNVDHVKKEQPTHNDNILIEMDNNVTIASDTTGDQSWISKFEANKN